MKFNTGGGDFETLEAGTYMARIYSIVDIGEQTYEDKAGRKKTQRKFVMSFEINELMEDGRPFVVSKFYTASLHDKASLTIDLNSIRGKAMTEDDKAKFDIANILNVPVMVTITHKEKQGGGVRVNVAGVANVPKGMEVPELRNEIIHFDIDDEKTHSALEKVPDWLKDKINWLTATDSKIGKPVPAPDPIPESEHDFDNPPF